MGLNEMVLLIQETPETVAGALDSLMAAHNYTRAAARELREDFTPLLRSGEGRIVFVISQPKHTWIACFSSLDWEVLWHVSEELAQAVEQPTCLALFAAEQHLVAYRFFQEGVLREEVTLAEAQANAQLDERQLLELLSRHDIPLALVRDRLDYFGEAHLALVYVYAPKSEFQTL